MFKNNFLIATFILSSVISLIFETAALAGIQKGPEANTSQKAIGISVRDGVVVQRQRNKPELRRDFHVPGKLLVKLKEGMKSDILTSFKKKHGLTVSEKKLSNRTHHRFKGIYDVSAGKRADLLALAAELKANYAVEYAEPISIAYTQFVPNDTLYAQQWSHKNTQAESGWDITTGDPATIIAVVDIGVDYNHPDLIANIWRDGQGNPGKDFVNIVTSDYTDAGFQLLSGEDYQVADYEPSDSNGHGTHVAGIIAAVGNNVIGISGVCPGCKIMPVRAGFSLRLGEQDYGMFQHDNLADAIIYAADNGAKIINMSFGGSPSQLLHDAIDYADSKGAVLIASAGNDNLPNTEYAYPAAYNNVMAVAATDINDAKTPYSNYGSWVQVAAPGGDELNPIFSTVPTYGSLGNATGYRGLYGTSMAASYVAGTAGLILSRHPGLNNRQVMQVLRQGTDVFNIHIPDSQYYVGTGRSNVDKTLQINSVSTSTVDISSPHADFVSGGLIAVNGNATAPYQVLYGLGIYPAAWTDFGSGQSMSGVLATLDSSTLSSPFDDYTIKLVAEDQAGKVETIVQGRIGKQFLPGWPQEYSFAGKAAPVWNSPTLADLDNDGFDEIIITGKDSLSRGIITVFRKDGTLAEGNWPQTVPVNGSSFDFGAVAGDINGNGNMQIIASVQGPSPSLMSWDRQGNLLWSRVLEPGIPALNISLADINGDGEVEIITQTLNSKLYVLDASGTVLWSYLLNEYDNWYNEKNVAVADFNGDGKQKILKNIIINVKFEPGDVYRTLGGSLAVFNHDGTLFWKHDWPEPGEQLATKYYAIYPTSSPLVGDINNDGKPETMVRVNIWKGDDTGTSEITTRFYAFDEAGAVLQGWPVSVSGYPAYSELALGDLNKDGYPELVGGAGGYIHALTSTGAYLFPPVPFNAVSNPTIADITGDGIPDILINDGSAFIVIQQDGTVSALPVKVKDSGNGNIHNTPVATDLDKNSTEDLIFIEWQNRPILWAWDLQIPHAPETELFTRAGFDAQHSNHFRPPLTAMTINTLPLLPAGFVGTPYSQTVTASGGKSPYLWSVTNGSLPDGLCLNAASGVISGTPGKTGTWSFTVKVTDVNKTTATRILTINIAPALPDLAVTSVSGPKYATGGKSITLSACVKNIGKGNAARSTVSFYLSSDATITGDDILLGEQKISALAAGAGKSVTTDVTIPMTLAAQTYYIGAVIDRQGILPETNEANNAKAGNIIYLKNKH